VLARCIAAFSFSCAGSEWVELFKDIAPHIGRVALIFNPKVAPFFDQFLRPATLAAATFKMVLTAAPVHTTSEIELAVNDFTREPNGGMFVIPDVFTTNHRALIIALAARHRMPAVYPYSYMAREGGLISYGVDPANLHRQAAIYVDRILRGARPADLPVQAPTKFEMVINLKTAKALGIEVPPTLLARADELVE